ncbi:MAG: glycosyltransferase family 2 protein [Chloroflexota bacterium]
MIQNSDIELQPEYTPGLLSIIIPNWNGAHFLPTCLDSLAAQTYENTEVIIADNASEDGSREMVERDYPWVKWVQLPENRGFTGACNAGMATACGEFICLLNNDTEGHPEWAARVVDAFSRDEKIGSVASKMLLFDRRDHIHTTGDMFTVNGRAVNRGVWEPDTGQYDTEEYVFSACGGSSTYRRDMLDEIGLLDDDFFFSGEDVDIGWRAQLRGWRCLYTPHAIVYHHLSATGGGVTSSYYDGRNLIYILVKDVPAAVWKQHGGKIVRAQWQLAVEAAKAWRGEAARARLRGMLAAVFALPKLLRKRSQTQQTRTVRNEYIEDILSPPV